MGSFVRIVVASVAVSALASCSANHGGLQYRSTGTGGAPGGGGFLGGDGGFVEARGGSGGIGGTVGAGGRGGSSVDARPGPDASPDISVSADGSRDINPLADVGQTAAGANGGAAGMGGAGGGGGGGAGGGSTCRGANSCNWCAGAMETDSSGCFSRWRCPNGADPCTISPCSSDASCPRGQTCRDRLCWPVGGTGGSRGPEGGTGGGDGGTGGGHGGTGGGGADGGRGDGPNPDGTGADGGNNSFGVGMACVTAPDCPTGTVCCDGTDPSCDGTRVPAGDGTNPGELVVAPDGLTVTDTITGLVWQRDLETQAACNGWATL